MILDKIFSLNPFVAFSPARTTLLSPPFHAPQHSAKTSLISFSRSATRQLCSFFLMVPLLLPLLWRLLFLQAKPPQPFLMHNLPNLLCNTLILLIRKWRKTMDFLHLVSQISIFLMNDPFSQQYSCLFCLYLLNSTLKSIVTECDMEVSLSAIKVARWKFAWKKTGPKYCQVIPEPKHTAPLAFSERCLEADETINDAIFTDESSIWIERHGRIFFRKEGMPATIKPKVKHPYKVHVWAGISKWGAMPIILSTGIMEADFYVDSILHDTLLPFVNQMFQDGNCFQQDNNPKHTIKFL